MVENVESEVLGMLTLMNAGNLACAGRILGLDVPEQKKEKHKNFLKYILRHLKSEGVKDIGDGDSTWYVKYTIFLE